MKKLIKYVLTIDRSPLFICSQAGREIRNSKRYGLRIRVNKKCCIVSNLASVRAQILNWSLAGFRKHVKFLKSLGGRDFADLKSLLRNFQKVKVFYSVDCSNQVKEG